MLLKVTEPVLLIKALPAPSKFVKTDSWLVCVTNGLLSVPIFPRSLVRVIVRPDKYPVGYSEYISCAADGDSRARCLIADCSPYADVGITVTVRLGASYNSTPGVYRSVQLHAAYGIQCQQAGASY